MEAETFKVLQCKAQTIHEAYISVREFEKYDVVKECNLTNHCLCLKMNVISLVAVQVSDLSVFIKCVCVFSSMFFLTRAM